MEEIFVSASDGEIVIHPLSRAEEIIQNVRMILSTPKGTLPLDRNFGLDFSVVDKPVDRAMVYLSVDVFQQLKRYEPRVELVRILYPESETDFINGQLRPNVMLKLKAENE